MTLGAGVGAGVTLPRDDAAGAERSSRPAWLRRSTDRITFERSPGTLRGFRDG